MSSPFGLDDKVAIVTGAGTGIGEAIAITFAAAGAHVTVADVDEGAVEGTANSIRSAGGQAAAYHVDVAQETSCAALAVEVVEELGRCDILVNNAGIGHVGSVMDTEPEAFRRVMAVNLEGMYLMSRAVLPDMLRRHDGVIVNLASALGLTTMSDRFAYTVSKHGVVGLTRSMAYDLAPQGVRVNCICPGRVDTPFVRARLAEYADPDAYIRHTAETHPIGRMARPEEIAQAALYLASPAGSYTTGSAMVVDGGYLAGK